MGEKIVIGPINKGLRNDRTAFVIDNDSFPTLINAYQWRGRIKRKRGTQFLCRLQRFLGITDGSGNATITISPVPIGTGITSYVIGTDIFVDPGTTANPGTQTLITNSIGTGTLVRTTGVLTITGSQAATKIFYYPSLPVMGLEDFVMSSNAFPGTIAFDPVYAYAIQTPFPYMSYDISFYKNPAVDAILLPGYVPKAASAPISWNGQDYQQFWTVNYQGALWATNGINIPFTTTNIGMQFNTITAVAIVAAGPPAFVTITTGTNHGLIIGDFVFINEIAGMTGINLQTGYVTAVPAANQITVELPFATVGGAWSSGGIVQYLTNRSDTTKDCLRWYDGDPTNGSATSPVLVKGNGWVNFMPPLNNPVAFPDFSIADLPPGKYYYLVGARMIVPFKDRLIFLGPVVQTSTDAPIYLQDTIIYSQNGTPYYTSSFTGDPLAATTLFHQILVPTNQTATAPAYFEDATGFGGFLTAGIDQPIVTAAFNEDVIIVGFRTLKTRLVYTGNDLVPFNFFQITTEYGDTSTFSIVTMDKGVITRGDKGFIITSQVDGQRFDLEIPDQVFEINATNNGNERFTAYRDFINEWIYFTYPSTQTTYIYPNQTLQFNYRDNSWAIFNESYTTYGTFRKQTGFTWSTVGDIYETWGEWNDPWNAGESQLLQPDVIAGNQQGFVLIRGEGTGEGTSLVIQNIVGSTITCPNHCLNVGDYIVINGVLGDVGDEVNGEIFSVQTTTTNTFILNPNITSSTYLGGGLITRMYVPFIQTKQFPVAWEMSRKTRLGPQQYLLSTTSNAQITLLIYLSQNSSSPYNNPGYPSPVQIVPQAGSLNNSLIYSTVLYTCPESTNLGLTPANVNLQMPTAIQQAQIWHRVNTSLIGDTIQLGFTMSDDQMRTKQVTIPSESYVITGATQADLCVLTCTSFFAVGQLVLINGVVGMTQLNGNIYVVDAVDSSTVTLGVDSTGFTAYVSGGTATLIDFPNQFSEIELHSIILDVQPSQLLA
jgi:hypothetical protein